MDQVEKKVALEVLEVYLRHCNDPGNCPTLQMVLPNLVKIVLYLAQVEKLRQREEV